MAFSYPLSAPQISRRQALGGLAATTALTAAGPALASPPLAASAPPALPPASAAQIDPQGVLDVIAHRLLAHEPERATGLGVDTGRYAWMRGRLEDQSQEGQDAFAATMREDLTYIRAIDTSGFDADTRTSYEVVESAYDTALAGMALPYGDIPVGSWRTAPYVVIQNVGTYLDMPRFLSSTHPLKDERDAAYYLDRLQQLPSVLDGELGRMRAARGMGVTPPDFLLKKAIGQMEATIADARDKSGSLVSPLREVNIPGSRQWPTNAYRIVQAGVVPALQRQLAELREQARVAGSAPGMSARPKGDEWYAWALRSSTTTSLSADDVHRQGLEELEELHGRMDPILRRIGYTSGTVGERMQALSADPRYKFAEGDPGRAEIMTFIKDRIGWIKAQMPRAFNTLVDPNLEVRRLPLAEEPGAPGAYGGAGSKDGTIPGRMWINLRTTDLHRKYDLADLTYHETIPGHVWEGEYSNRLPLIRSILAFNAFSEGWALYAEQLADELGAYDDFEVGRLGYLQSLAFRACRMVVDTGLHSKQWSRDKAVDFFVTRNGSKRQEVESEVDRYCSWPGQATGYKLGHSEIVRQRARAETEMGEAYDFKAFNDAVVLGGNAPLDVMANNVSRYIATARG
ncbi:DUF885 domain-containing protein [Paraurantiacibacter namhicola]|uniref:DUF885 domain-containing protein n=1 Tax=Paraurantiacibacter namhicola TaxID=645517 RepID=A0A1C7D7R4_9SPHN|nr:DUF885 domain-containing protein [Paraurantiacibacter namhicola]ANU07488.1 hypothetical protein A6F65_01181 [Paraurantiacibacter namhicola]